MGIRAYINDVIDPIFLQAIYIYLFLRADENGEVVVAASQIAAHFGIDSSIASRLIRELAIRGFVKILNISTKVPYRKKFMLLNTLTIKILDYKTRKDFFDAILLKPAWELDLNELVDSNGQDGVE